MAKIGPAQKALIKELNKTPVDQGDLRTMFRLILLSKPKKKRTLTQIALYYTAAGLVAAVVLAVIDGFIG